MPTTENKIQHSTCVVPMIIIIDGFCGNVCSSKSRCTVNAIVSIVSMAFQKISDILSKIALCLSSPFYSSLNSHNCQNSPLTHSRSRSNSCAPKQSLHSTQSPMNAADNPLCSSTLGQRSNRRSMHFKHNSFSSLSPFWGSG